MRQAILDPATVAGSLGDSEMAHRVRAFNWSATPLGPLAGWPASLRTAVALCLHSRFPMAVSWGPALHCIYNDAHADVLGERHPGVLGLPARDFLDGSWDLLEPRLRAVVATGEGAWAEDAPLSFDRSGRPALGFFTYSYSPIPDGAGGVGGILVVFHDTTARVNSHRRAELLGRLSASTAGAVSDGEICVRAVEELEGSLDLPLTAVLLTEPDGAHVACAAVGGSSGRRPQVRPGIPLSDPADAAAAILRRVAADPAPGSLVDAGPFLAPGARWDGPERAWVGAIRHSVGDPPVGFVVAGVDDRLVFDAPYRAFLQLVAGQLGQAVLTAQAKEAERRVAREPELHALLDELRAAQRRIAAAGDVERQRIERDLHDGAQQRLVALQFELGLLGEQLEDDPRAAGEQLRRLRRELDEALAELRELAHGVYPPLLASDGLVAALAAAARRAPMPVTLTADEFGPLPRAVQAAAYFCCVEALQNVAKHAGDAARVRLRLEVDDGALCFQVEDDGVGFGADAVVAGHGLVNLRDRLAALGGASEVRSTPSRGTSVSGRIPLG